MVCYTALSINSCKLILRFTARAAEREATVFMTIRCFEKYTNHIRSENGNPWCFLCVLFSWSFPQCIVSCDDRSTAANLNNHHQVIDVSVLLFQLCCRVFKTRLSYIIKNIVKEKIRLQSNAHVPSDAVRKRGRLCSIFINSFKSKHQIHQ